MFKTYNSRLKHGLSMFFNAKQTDVVYKEDIFYEFTKINSNKKLPNKLLKTIDEDVRIEFKMR